MSIVKQISKGAKFIQTVNFFQATYNNPTPGRYDFGVNANTRQNVIGINKDSLYFIDRINFSCTLPESEYLSVIDTTPEIQLFYGQRGGPVYVKPLPVVNFIDNQETNTYFQNFGQDNFSDTFLTVSMRGTLNQSAALVGVTEIKAQLSFNIYEVTEQEFIRAFNNAYPAGSVNYGLL